MCGSNKTNNASKRGETKIHRVNAYGTKTSLTGLNKNDEIIEKLA